MPKINSIKDSNKFRLVQFNTQDISPRQSTSVFDTQSENSGPLKGNRQPSRNRLSSLASSYFKMPDLHSFDELQTQHSMRSTRSTYTVHKVPCEMIKKDFIIEDLMRITIFNSKKTSRSSLDTSMMNDTMTSMSQRESIIDATARGYSSMRGLKKIRRESAVDPMNLTMEGSIRGLTSRSKLSAVNNQMSDLSIDLGRKISSSSLDPRHQTNVQPPVETRERPKMSVSDAFVSVKSGSVARIAQQDPVLSENNSAQHSDSQNVAYTAEKSSEALTSNNSVSGKKESSKSENINSASENVKPAPENQIYQQNDTSGQKEPEAAQSPLKTQSECAKPQQENSEPASSVPPVLKSYSECAKELPKLDPAAVVSSTVKI